MADHLSLFKEWAPQIAKVLEHTFDLDREETIAILGNLGHESGGFKSLQEKKPLIPGSRGGYGIAQWTGPRRKRYENHCAARGLDPASLEANLTYLVWELQNDPVESKAIQAVKNAQGRRAKVIAFETSFERAHKNYKHYDSRMKWASIAERVLAGEPVRIPRVPGRKKPPNPGWAEQKLNPFEIKAIQQRLRELGWVQVGKVDGSWGPSTAGAIAALQQQAKASNPAIVVDGHYGPQTRELLQNGVTRELPKRRLDTTENDLRQQGSRTIDAGDKVQGSGAIVTGGSLLALIMGGLAEFSTQALDLIRPIMQTFERLPWWVWPILLIALSAYQAYQAQRAMNARLEDERLGLHAGRPDPSPSPPVTASADMDWSGP